MWYRQNNVRHLAVAAAIAVALWAPTAMATEPSWAPSGALFDAAAAGDVRAEHQVIQMWKKAGRASHVNAYVIFAQYSLGIFYAHGGWGLRKNYGKAFYWYATAAQEGDAMAANWVGLSYWYGRGVPHSYRLAVFWLKRAEQGSCVSGNRLPQTCTVAKKNLRIINRLEAAVIERRDAALNRKSAAK